MTTSFSLGLGIGPGPTSTCAFSAGIQAASLLVIGDIFVLEDIRDMESKGECWYRYDFYGE